MDYYLILQTRLSIMFFLFVAGHEGITLLEGNGRPSLDSIDELAGVQWAVELATLFGIL
jgi:hypothetical protein